MSQVIVLHWNKNTLRAVVVGRRVAHSEVEAVLDIPLEDVDDTKAIGQLLKESLAQYRPGRAKVIVAISRDLLTWQHLDLPPCPEEDLPDLVYMQAGFDTTSTGEAIGFDFLPLAGSDQTPRRVLAISLQPEELTELQEICEAADLTPKRFVPLALGWPAAARRATRGDSQPIAVFVAPFAQESTIWATIGGRIVLFRQVHLPSTDDIPALSSKVGAELRRTIFALAQQYPEHSGASAWVVGKKPDEVSQIAETLDEQLDFDVQPMDFASDSALLSTKVSAEASTSDTLPLAGLALDEAAGNAPLVDLFDPRKRPAPRAGKRTYALVAAVVASLFAYGSWHGYTVLNAPVEKAYVIQTELDLLAKSEKKLEADEEFAEYIRNWQDDSVNILTELRQLSEKVRPIALEAEGFNVEKDVVLEKLNINGTRLDMDVALRNYPAVGDFVDRLQDWEEGFKRDTAEERGSPPDYDVWLIHASVDFSEEVEQEESPKK